MSTSDPCGTWQYAHSVWRPAGARVGSHAVAWAASTNGRSGWPPRATEASAAAISSNVPPRWTVPALATAGSRHGTGRRQRVVELERAGPAAEAAVAPSRHRASRRSPAMRTSASGATSATTMASGGSLARSSTRWPHSTRAAVLAQDRHEGVGHRLRAAPGDRPADEVGVRGEREADAGREPAVEAQHRVGGEAGEQRAARLGRQAAQGEALGAEQTRQGEAGQRHGVAGQRRQREQVVGGTEPADERRHQPAPGVAVATEPGGRRRRASGAAAPCGRRAGGRGRSRGGPSGRRARPAAGRAGPANRGPSAAPTAQTSWRKPGSVSSAVRQPPPGVGAASRTVTRLPAEPS